MIDPAQILLFIIILILTILLIVLGIQVSFILKDLRKTIAKTNKVLDDTGQITEGIAGPVTGLSQAIIGVKAGATLANLFRRVTEEDKEEKSGK